MNILAVDTTEEKLSVALEAGGRVFFSDRKLKAPHDETLLPAVARLLQNTGIEMKDLDAIAVASGPGRFTGIRIGMAYAAVASAQLRIPALALTRFEAAASKRKEKAACFAIEGFRGEKSYQLFKNGRTYGKPVWVRADEWAACAKDLERKGFLVVLEPPSAKDLLAPAMRRLAKKKMPRFEPLYLKPASYERKTSVVR